MEWEAQCNQKSPMKQKRDAGKKQKRDMWQGRTGQRKAMSLGVKLEEGGHEPLERQRHRFSPRTSKVKPHHTSDLWKCKMFNVCCVKLWCLQWFVQAAAGDTASLASLSLVWCTAWVGDKEREERNQRDSGGPWADPGGLQSHFKRFNFKKNKKL